MNKKIDNPTDCEVLSVIRFLNAQNVRAIDIQRQLTAVYGELWGGYGTPFETDGGAYCQAAWCSCMTMCACMLLPERK
jgi:hypothetical protein